MASYFFLLHLQIQLKKSMPVGTYCCMFLLVNLQLIYEIGNWLSEPR
jgi:hypothetical protein